MHNDALKILNKNYFLWTEIPVLISVILDNELASLIHTWNKLNKIESIEISRHHHGWILQRLVAKPKIISHTCSEYYSCCKPLLYQLVMLYKYFRSELFLTESLALTLKLWRFTNPHVESLDKDVQGDILLLKILTVWGNLYCISWSKKINT